MRRLVVCADGTWKSRDDSSDATNVEKLHDAVLTVAADGTLQQTLREATDDDVCESDVSDSYRRLYRLQQPLVREIGTPPVTVDGRVLHTHERVHPSAVERHRRLTAPPRGPYAPENLLAFLSRTAPAQRDGTHESTTGRRSTPAGG